MGARPEELAISAVSGFHFVFLRRPRNSSLVSRLLASMLRLRGRNCPIKDMDAVRQDKSFLSRRREAVAAKYLSRPT